MGELQDCRGRLDSMTKEAECANSELRLLRPDVASTREALASKETELLMTQKILSDQKGELLVIRDKHAELLSSLTCVRAEKECFKKHLDVAKLSIANLSEAYVYLLSFQCHISAHIIYLCPTDIPPLTMLLWN